MNQLLLGRPRFLGLVGSTVAVFKTASGVLLVGSVAGETTLSVREIFSSTRLLSAFVLLIFTGILTGLSHPLELTGISVTSLDCVSSLLADALTGI